MTGALTVVSARPPFEGVYGEFLPRITGYLRANLPDPSDADDVAAQVFARALGAYTRFEPRGGGPAAWLFRIARNAAHDHRRRLMLRQRAETKFAADSSDADDPTRLVEQRFVYRQLRFAIARLPQRQREVLALRHEAGLSFKEVGGRLGCSEDAAKMLYHRSLRAIRPLVTEGMAA